MSTEITMFASRSSLAMRLSKIPAATVDMETDTSQSTEEKQRSELADLSL
jgi:hypothetical protein